MSKMFKVEGKTMRTWNPFTGCRFQCTYCWARRLAEGRLRHLEKYRNGFEPTFHLEELKKPFKPGEFVFVCDMGDISCAYYSDRVAILERVRHFPETSFLFQSKNPAGLIEVSDHIGPNVYVGTTLETNRNYHLTQAPSPYQRYVEMCYLDPPAHKFISIEPVLDFDLEVLVSWIEKIQPDIVQIGADNHRYCHLPEPPWGKVEDLLVSLREFVTRVEVKAGLERLKEGIGND